MVIQDTGLAHVCFRSLITPKMTERTGRSAKCRRDGEGFSHRWNSIYKRLPRFCPFCGAMFTRIEAGQDHAARLADATKAALAVLVILVIAALAGARVL